MLLTIIAFGYFLILFALCFVYQKDIKNIGNFMLGWYLFSLFNAIFVVDPKFNYSISATFYFLITLTFWLLPAITFNQKKNKNIKRVNVWLFNFISKIFIFLGISCYLFFIPVIVSIISLGLSIKGVRGEIAGGEVFYQDDSIIYYVLTLYCQFFPIVIAFYFYSIAFLDKSKIFNNLLLFSSTGYIVNVLASLGRSGLVYWPLMFLFIYTLFRSHLNLENRLRTFNIIKKIGLTIMLPILSIITYDRFAADNEDGAFVNSILIYFGEQFGNFNLFFNLYQPTGGLKKLFPITEIGREKIIPIDEAKMSMLYYGVDGNVFSTFIGDFIKLIDKLNLFIFSIIYGSVCSFYFRVKETISFGKVLLLILLCQIPLTGIFFYDYSYVVSNIYMIIVLILGVIFSNNYVLFKSK
jgi:oligosaccharide repeat unit polymerase